MANNDSSGRGDSGDRGDSFVLWVCVLLVVIIAALGVLWIKQRHEWQIERQRLLQQIEELSAKYRLLQQQSVPVQLLDQQGEGEDAPSNTDAPADDEVEAGGVEGSE